MVYNKKENKGQKRSDTPTPIWLCDNLHEIIAEHYKPGIILDPCCGDGRLTNKFNSQIVDYFFGLNWSFQIVWQTANLASLSGNSSPILALPMQR